MVKVGNYALEGDLLDKFQLENFQEFLRGIEVIDQRKIRLTLWNSKYFSLIIHHELDKYYQVRKKSDYAVNAVLWNCTKGIYTNYYCGILCEVTTEEDIVKLDYEFEWEEVTYGI